jgi:hypothetical protein
MTSTPHKPTPSATCHPQEGRDKNKIHAENIPVCLKQLPRWVCWRYENHGKPKLDKVPIDPKTGNRASSTDPATWTTFEEALATFQQSDDLDGIGFVFAAGGGDCGVDLDKSIDPTTGLLKPWARQFVDQLNSYTEISPSGTGVKVFIRASKPGDRCRTAYQDGEVEIYDSGRFFTVTTQRMDGLSAAVEERQAQLEEIYATVFGDSKPASKSQPPPPTGQAPAISDDEIIRLACSSRKLGAKFTALWAGQWENRFTSASEADSSLVFMLAFYTKDAAQLDRIFRRSGLKRDKWDEQRGENTYGQETIRKALELVTEQYQPRKKDRKPPVGPALPSVPANGNLPQIIIDNIQLSDLTAAGINALRRANVPPIIFVRSGALSRVTPDEKGQPAIEQVDKAKLRARLTVVSVFFSIGKKDNLVGTNPPLALCENILAQGAWHFPPLIGVARSPILRRDGTICTKPGYDAESQLYYWPDLGLVVPPIPNNPSVDEVKVAKGALIDLIVEFPFADAAGIPNAIAILLTILMRSVISGHVPLAIVDAPLQGTGKTLMVTVLGIVAIGLVCGESIPDKQNADEWRKKITSVLLKGMPLVLLDNVPDNSTIDAPPLAAMLTTHIWSDRILGKTESVQLPARSVWVATGNNLRVAGDMPRRCYTIRMDANTEKPWTRTKFKHPDIEEYAVTNRGRLLAAAFTLIRAWYAAGKPKANVPAFGSFQEWADTIGSVLAHAGIKGFLANLDDVRAIQDEDTLQWQAFFAAWWNLFAERTKTADDIAQRILEDKMHSDIPLPDTLLVNLDKGDGALKRSLGHNLSRLTGRLFDGRKLCDAGTDAHRKVRTWRLSPQNGSIPGGATPLSPHNPAANPADGGEQ